MSSFTSNQLLRLDPKLNCDQISKWRFQKTSIALTDPRLNPKNHIYTILKGRGKPPRLALSTETMNLSQPFEFVFLCDSKSMIYDDADNKIPMPVTKNYTTILSAHLPREWITPEVLETVTKDWYSSLANGHTSRKDKIDHVDSCVTALLNEQALLRLLPSNTSTAPQIHVRISKMIVDIHDCDNSVALMFGKSSVMKACAVETTEALKGPERLHDDQATAIVAIPLSLLRDHASNTAACLQAVLDEIEASNPTVHELIKDMQVSTGNVKLLNHIEGNLLDGLKPNGKWLADDLFKNLDDRKFCPWLPSELLIAPDDVSILLTFTKWKSSCDISLPGGKRSLGENSLQCCVRETREETGLDLSQARMRASDNFAAPRPNSSCPWTLALHLQLNLNCYVYLHDSLFLEA
jgi:hypothetical protein